MKAVKEEKTGTSCPSCSPSCRIFSLKKSFIHLSKRLPPRCASAQTTDVLSFSVSLNTYSRCCSPSQYPEWLEANKPSLSAQDHQRYEQQANVMGEICRLFEKEEEGAEDKERTFESIMDLMQKVPQLIFMSHTQIQS